MSPSTLPLGTSVNALNPVPATQNVAQEIEALRREVERLRLTADRTLLDLVLQQSPHGIIVSDAKGTLLLQNAAAERIWAGSATSTDVAGWGQYRAFHPDGTPFKGEDWAMARCLRERAAVPAQEFHIQRFDGSDGWLLGSSAPLLAADGSLRGAVSVFADITHHRTLARDRDHLAQELRAHLDELERERARFQALNAVIADVARARGVGEVARVTVDSTHAFLGAELTLAYLLEADGLLHLAAHRNANPGVEARYPTLPVDSSMPLAEAVRTGQPVFLETPETLAERWPNVAAMRIHGKPIGAVAAVPFTADGKTVGGVAYCYTAARSFTAGDRRFLRAMALQCVPALERAGAFDREVEARQRAEELSEKLRRRQESLEVLADVGAMFAADLDFEHRMREVARLVVPRLADWCAIDVLEGGTLRRLAVHHTDPAKIELAYELQRRYPPRLDAPTGVPKVLRTGETDFFPEIDDALLRRVVPDPEQYTLIRHLNLRSSVVVPIRSRQRVLGALTLVHAESGRRFGPEDVALAEEVARRAGAAVEIASVYREAEAARRNLTAVFQQAPAPIAILRGPEHVFEFANPQYDALVGHRPLLGRRVADALPEAAAQGFVALLDRVYRTGETYEGRDTPVRLREGSTGEEKVRYLNFIYQASHDGYGAIDGVLVFAFDVTAQVEAARAEERTSAFLRSRNAQLALNADVGTAFTQARELREMLQRVCEAVVARLDAAFARIWTLGAAGQTLELQASAGLYTHLDGKHASVPVGQFKIGLIAAEKRPHLTNDVLHDPRVGDRAWAAREGMVAFAGYPLMVEGRLVGVIALFSKRPLAEDVLSALAAISDTIAVGIERKRAEQHLQEERESLDVINRVGQTLAAELNLDALVQAITDSATRLCGAQFGAFFYNVVDKAGERYTLYAISGVPREAFSKFPMPRNTAIFAPTFNGEGVVRLDDVTADPRFGKNAPYHGMPKGHLPVRSYLAVPVISRTGEVIGGLFFGHARPAVFTERAERLVQGVASQAAVAMDNARLFADAQRLIGALERTNAELDQFAYVASHDLKAPLRGIANLSQWLEDDLGATLSGDARRQFQLLRGRVARMEALINGILAYSRAGRTRTAPETVDVGAVLHEIIELVSPAAPARVQLQGAFPVLVTEKVPIQQALMNLIANALKHAGRPDVTITVSAHERGQDHWEFRVRDDGVGIAPEFHERIWAIFQTLEARDKVESTGIGLSIVRKIVESRGGSVALESAPGQGATFAFTWPRNEEASR